MGTTVDYTSIALWAPRTCSTILRCAAKRRRTSPSVPDRMKGSTRRIPIYKNRWEGLFSSGIWTAATWTFLEGQLPNLAVKLQTNDKDVFVGLVLAIEFTAFSLRVPKKS